MDNSAGSNQAGSSPGGSATGGDAPSNLLRFPATPRPVTFDRKELTLILDLYGRHVANGEWRDYAMDFDREAAVFSVFRRASEHPLYRIAKTPQDARRNALYAVVAHGGLVMKRGNDLGQVLRVLVKKPRANDA